MLFRRYRVRNGFGEKNVLGEFGRTKTEPEKGLPTNFFSVHIKPESSFGKKKTFRCVYSIVYTSRRPEIEACEGLEKKFFPRVHNI